MEDKLLTGTCNIGRHSKLTRDASDDMLVQNLKINEGYMGILILIM